MKERIAHDPRCHAEVVKDELLRPPLLHDLTGDQALPARLPDAADRLQKGRLSAAGYQMRMTDRDPARETVEEDQDTKKQEHRQLFLKGQEKDPAHQLHGKSIRQPFKHVIHLSSPPSVYIVFSEIKKLSFPPNKNARHR